MNSPVRHETTPNAVPSRFARPIWTLLLLAPFVAEVLSGATRTSVLFVYVPEVMVWGVGALLCRELVRRWRAGGVSLLLMGLALSVAEEFLIQQTSLAPLPFPGSHPEYGRMWGVNLVYFLFMLGYESVWVVLVPVQLTQLFFPRQAVQPWLRKRGTIVACVVFLLGCRIAWFGWTQKARPQLHAAPYHPPLGLLVLGALMIMALVATAYLVRGLGQTSPLSHNNRHATAPAWLAALTGFVMGSAWFELIGQNFVANPLQPFWISIMAGIAWAALAFTLFFWWSSRRTWGEIHKFAAASGATLGCMVMPYLTAASWPKIDLVGKMSFDALALVGIVLLANQVFARARAAEVDAPDQPASS